MPDQLRRRARCRIWYHTTRWPGGERNSRPDQRPDQNNRNTDRPAGSGRPARPNPTEISPYIASEVYRPALRECVARHAAETIFEALDDVVAIHARADDPPALDHEFRRRESAKVGRRVAIDEDEVGELPDFDRAEIASRPSRSAAAESPP